MPKVKRELIPWRAVKLWRCLRCGGCCRRYLVQVKTPEAYYLLRTFGDVIIPLDNELYLAKKGDGSCIFLREAGGLTYCSIYLYRPRSCRLFPFQIYREPVLGDPQLDRLAEYKTPQGTVYVYLDGKCPGIDAKGGQSIAHLVAKAVEVWREYKAMT